MNGMLMKEKKMLACEVRGGLGNQLFQVFATVSAALDAGVPYAFVGSDTAAMGGRPTYWRTFFSALPTVPQSSILAYRVHYDEIPEIDKNERVLLRGYFQDLCLFDARRDEIAALLNFPVYLKPPAPTEGEGPLCAVHVRAGDYRLYPRVYPILTAAYYKQAVARLADESGVRRFRFRLFCEYPWQCAADAELVASVRDALEEWGSVEERRGGHEVLQLDAMRQCDFHVIANSTFSWWGAYLSATQHVAYPAQWFCAPRPAPAILPAGWLPIEYIKEPREECASASADPSAAFAPAGVFA